MQINPTAFCLMMIVAGCGGSAAFVSTPPTPPGTAPSIAIAPAQNGAVIVTLSDNPVGANIYYTLDAVFCAISGGL
jgi:hypothetical protein